MKNIILVLLILCNSDYLLDAKSLKQLPVGIDVLECQACNVLLPIARFLVKSDRTSYLNFICAKLNIENGYVCDSLLNTYMDSIIKVAKYSPLSTSEICSAMLRCEPINNPIFNWNITLPNIPKPPVLPRKRPSPCAPKIRILHLSDIHVDFDYQPGSLADCNQPLCCRNSSTPTINRKNLDKSFAWDTNKTAGYWGDYRNCDVPIWTIENMFSHIAKNEKFDVIYMTGDIPSHNVWSQTKYDQLNSISILTDLLVKYFPDKVIYSTLGNHESAPSNLFPTNNQKQDDISWLYRALAESWIKTGLPEDLKENITKGAFYTIQMAPGLRIISLNMNYCYNLNFWLLINSVDPLGQLAWLVDTLQKSENIGEKVHIIGHVDPMNCFDSWGKSYYRIINRYESTITGQFFGHTHFDQFEMFYDLNNHSRPVGVAYIAGSITSYSYENPNYRIYTVDGNYENSSWEVLDHETYYLNLTDANLNMKTDWKREYSAKEAFSMDSLYPEDWGELLSKMLSDLNGDLVKKMYEYYYSSSANEYETCDLKCRKEFVCKFKQARSDNFIAC